MIKEAGQGVSGPVRGRGWPGVLQQCVHWCPWAGEAGRGPPRLPPSAVTMPCSPPDVSDITWRGRLAPRGAGPKRQLGDHSADPEALPAPEGWPPSPTREGPEHPGTPPSKALLSSPVKNGESPGQEGLAPERLACLLLDAQRPPADQDRGFLDKSRLRKVRTLPRLPPDGPESGALCLSLTSVKTPLPTSEFFPPDPKKAFPEGKHGLSSFQAQPGSRLWLERELELRRRGDKRVGGVSPARESPPPGSEGPRDAGGDPGTLEPDEGTADGAGEPDRAAAEQVGDWVPHTGRVLRTLTGALRVLGIYPKEGGQPQLHFGSVSKL